MRGLTELRELVDPPAPAPEPVEQLADIAKAMQPVEVLALTPAEHAEQVREIAKTVRWVLAPTGDVPGN